MLFLSVSLLCLYQSRTSITWGKKCSLLVFQFIIRIIYSKWIVFITLLRKCTTILSTYLCIYLSIYLSIYLAMPPIIYLCIYPSIYLYRYLYHLYTDVIWVSWMHLSRYFPLTFCFNIFVFIIRLYIPETTANIMFFYPVPLFLSHILALIHFQLRGKLDNMHNQRSLLHYAKGPDFTIHADIILRFTHHFRIELKCMMFRPRFSTC